MAKDPYGDDVFTDDTPVPPTGSSTPASPAGDAYDVTPTSKKIHPVDVFLDALDLDHTFSSLPYGSQERLRVELRYQFPKEKVAAQALADRIMPQGNLSDYGRGLLFGQNGLLKDLSDKQAVTDFKDAKTRFDSSFDDMVTLPLQAAIAQARAAGRITAGADLTLLNQDYSRAQAWSDFYRGYSQLYEEPLARGFQSATGPRSTGSIMDHFFRTYADTQAALAGVDLPQTANIEAVKATLRAAVQPTLARIGQQQVAGELFDGAVRATQLKLAKLVANPNLSEADRDSLTGTQYDLGTHAPALREQYRTTGGMPPEDFLNVNFLDSALHSATLAGDDTHAAYVKGDPVKTLGNIDIIAKAKAAKDLTANAAEIVSTIRDPKVAAQFPPDKIAGYAAQGPTGLVRLRTDVNNAERVGATQEASATFLSNAKAHLASLVQSKHLDPETAAKYDDATLNAFFHGHDPKTALTDFTTAVLGEGIPVGPAASPASTAPAAPPPGVRPQPTAFPLENPAQMVAGDQPVVPPGTQPGNPALPTATVIPPKTPVTTGGVATVATANKAKTLAQWLARGAATIAASKLTPAQQAEFRGRLGQYATDAETQGHNNPDALLERDVMHEGALATARTKMADEQKAKAEWLAEKSTALQKAVSPNIFHSLLGHLDLGSMYDQNKAKGGDANKDFEEALAPYSLATNKYAQLNTLNQGINAAGGREGQDVPTNYGTPGGGGWPEVPGHQSGGSPGLILTPEERAAMNRRAQEQLQRTGPSPTAVGAA